VRAATFREDIAKTHEILDNYQSYDLLGGVLLGMIEIFASAYISTQLSNAIVFAVLIVVLLVRPTGLLGKQVREKV